MKDIVKQLHAEAAEDYRRHNSPETQAAAREQLAQARISGNEAGSNWRGQNGSAR